MQTVQNGNIQAPSVPVPTQKAVTDVPTGESALLAELARLKAENQALKTREEMAVQFKVTEGHQIHISGLGPRFGYTMGYEDVLKFLSLDSSLRSFIEGNRAKLWTNAEIRAAYKAKEKTQE